VFESLLKEKNGNEFKYVSHSCMAANEISHQEDSRGIRGTPMDPFSLLSLSILETKQSIKKSQKKTD